MTSPLRNHNKVPIGPLDPNEPPPHEPELRREDEIDVHTAVKALRSMGVEISERDLEYWDSTGEGPAYRPMYQPPKRYRWGELLDFAARTYSIDILNRKEATEYIRSLGYRIGPTTLSLLRTKGPPFVRLGRAVYYKREDLKEWVEGRGPPHSTAPKHKPLNAKKRCPSDYKDCPNVKHKQCAKYLLALCHFTHLPDRP